MCGVDPPPAADVVFKADDSSKAYCAALSAYDSQLEKVASSRFDPDAMRTFLTADSFAEALDELDATAPSEIAADVKAETEWFRGRWSDVIAEFDYDIRRIWLDAAPEDRAVFYALATPPLSNTPLAPRPTKSRSARNEKRSSGLEPGSCLRSPERVPRTCPQIPARAP